MSKRKHTNPLTPINMQDYLTLEIERLAQMGYRFPEDLTKLLNRRAKTLDKMIAADRTRSAYADWKDEVDETEEAK